MMVQKMLKLGTITIFKSFLEMPEMPLINCEIDLILTWSNRYLVIDKHIANQVAAFAITDTELYVPLVIKTQDNVKLLEQLKSSFKRADNWNKYEPKITVQEQSLYLYSLINPSFQGLNI